MVMDPPFGGMIEALAATVCKIEKKWQLISGTSSLFFVITYKYWGVEFLCQTCLTWSHHIQVKLKNPIYLS